MDIKIIFNEVDVGLVPHMVHAKNVTFLCDYGVDKIIVEDTDGYFHEWEVEPSTQMIRIEDKGS
jgi:hypothetical protein